MKYKLVVILMAVLALSNGLTAGIIRNQITCTDKNKKGTHVGTGYQYDIPCTEIKKMVGDIVPETGAYDAGTEICGKYITPEDAPVNIDGPCGGSNAVARQSTE